MKYDHLIKTLAACASLGVLAGCTPAINSTSTSVSPHGERWQISAVYIDDATPPRLPESIGSQAFLTVGTSTVVGSTGCQLLTGKATWANLEGGQSVQFDVATRDQACDPLTAHYSDLIRGFLGVPLQVSTDGDALKLEREDGAIMELVQ